MNLDSLHCVQGTVHWLMYMSSMHTKLYRQFCHTFFVFDIWKLKPVFMVVLLYISF